MVRTPVFLMLVVALAAGAWLVACGDEAQTDPVAGASDDLVQADVLALRREVLHQAGHEVIMPTYQAFLDSARTLEEATAAWATSGDAADRSAAQDAWAQTTSVWQEAEVMQVGPAGMSGAVLAGADLRDEVYSWPLVNRCRVDQEVVEAVFEDSAVFAAEKVNVRGLDAMEYLLFAQGQDNACNPSSGINRDGTWSALDDIDGRRARYAHTLSVLLVTQAQGLVDAWTQGGFAKQLADAGQSGSAYPNTQAGLNALSDSLFYLDKETKDMKLARPTGLSECDEATCPDALESAFAQRSREHVLHNLLGFKKLFTGGDAPDAPGFDDLLRDAGAEDISTDMVTILDEAIAQAQAITMPFAQALQEDPQALVDLYDTIKRLTDILKTDFVSVLDLELPARAEGDND